MKSFQEYIWEKVDYVPIGKNKNVQIHHVSSHAHLRNLTQKSQYGEVRTLHYTSPEGFHRTIAWDGAHSNHDQIIHHHPEIGPKAAPDTHIRGNVSLDVADNRHMMASFSHHGQNEDGSHTPAHAQHPHISKMFKKHRSTKPDGLTKEWGHTTTSHYTHKEVE